MSVLVTGGAGYIGSHMALHLLEKGETVVVCDDLSRGDISLVPPEALFIQQDVGDATAMSRIMREHAIEAVIHFAGFAVVPESVANPALYFDRNTFTSLRLAQACVDAGIGRFIFSSTAAVYGEADRDLVCEATPLNPISPYGRSKLMTEAMLRDLGLANGLRSVCLRYFNVAGADPQLRSGQSSPGATHLIKVLSQVAVGDRDSLTIFGDDYPTPDGTCVRDYIHVTDLVDAHYLALLDLRKGAGEVQKIYNCGYGVGASVRQVVAAVERSLNARLPAQIGGRRPGDPAKLVADSTAIRRDLGWTPAYDDLDTIVRTALEWERSIKSRSPA